MVLLKVTSQVTHIKSVPSFSQSLNLRQICIFDFTIETSIVAKNWPKFLPKTFRGRRFFHKISNIFAKIKAMDFFQVEIRFSSYVIELVAVNVIAEIW